MRQPVLHTLSLFVFCSAVAALPANADPVTITGGRVTAQMTGGQFTRGVVGSFFASDITYQFADASTSPTLEPASLLLLGTGLAGLVTRRIRAQR